MRRYTKKELEESIKYWGLDDKSLSYFFSKKPVLDFIEPSKISHSFVHAWSMQYFLDVITYYLLKTSKDKAQAKHKLSYLQFYVFDKILVQVFPRKNSISRHINRFLKNKMPKE